ncbi:MAG TPA: hypothetical protein VF384_15950 [Planctomycetota bacterium]
MKAIQRQAALWTAVLLPLGLFGCSPSSDDVGSTEETETELQPDERFSASGLQSLVVSPLTSTYIWRNRSNKDLPYTRVITQPWVTASGPATGVLMGNSEMTITVTLDEVLTSQLPVGTHLAQIKYLKPNLNSAYRTIDVEVRIDPPAQSYSMNLQPPSGVTASGPAGGPVTPMSRGYVWANNGSGPLSYSRTISAPWVTVSGGSTGTVGNGQQIAFEVALTSQVLGFAPGHYSATVEFREASGTTVVQAIPVALTIQTVASVLTPSGGLASSGVVGGPFTPSSQNFNWSNPGTTALQYERVVTQPWVTTTAPASGSLGAGQALSFTVALNASLTASLPAGTHNAEVRFINAATTSVTIVTVPVTLSITSGGSTAPINLTAVVTGSNIWRTHPPGALFTVNVSVSGDPLQGTPVHCQWVDEHRQPLGALIPVSPTPTAIQSPSTAPGFYGLVFSSPDADVRFLPQPAGFPSAVHGFAVVPNPPTGTPVIEPNSPFGMIQIKITDPYVRAGSGPRVIGLHLKSKTWQQSVSTWSSEVQTISNAGSTEMPLISDDPWDSVDTAPIGATQLDAIGTKFRNVLQASPNQVEYWQASREENGGGNPYAQSHYFSNLLAKIVELRNEANAINPNVKFTYSTRGFDLVEFEQLFASQAFRTYYAGLAQDPYKWPDFPTPEGWLPGHISSLRTRMINAGCAQHLLWWGEVGLPARGHNDPSAFFGYPETQDEVPGATLDYYARYMVKVHALSIAHGIKRIYWYNYKNRGNDIDYAEHHFGLRSYTTSSSDPGHPFPAYVAYINMLAHLKGCTFVEMRNPSSNVFVFEWTVDGTTARRILAWVNPAQTVTMALTTLKSGLQASSVQSVSDIYGRAVSAISSQQITLDGRPLYLRF